MKINVATSGWSYKHWYGLFYPEELKPINFLEHYTKYFDCIELNASFYHLPKQKTIENWHKRTPDNFKFAIKLSKTITHYHKLEKKGR
jgi:uncharacterized protein YecE (DUF72 family)